MAVYYVSNKVTSARHALEDDLELENVSHIFKYAVFQACDSIFQKYVDFEQYMELSKAFWDDVLFVCRPMPENHRTVCYYF
jgi:hypothetical protein